MDSHISRRTSVENNTSPSVDDPHPNSSASQMNIKNELEKNPFRVPTDEEVFVMRDEQKKKRTREREEQLRLKVYEKKTWASRLSIKRYNELAPTEETKLPSLVNKEKIDKPYLSREKENIKEFIDKKKQMFLLQMSLDTKKLEIKKLERKADDRERKLEQEELALKRDAQRFDDFLTENDIRSVEAANAAQHESKLKKQKQDELKAINQKKAAIAMEIQKLDDQLASCKRYKAFLDKLTPKEYSEDSSSRSNHEHHSEEVAGESKREYNDMYFQHPDQLLQVFGDLEEDNLGFIQASQDSEEQLDDMQKVSLATKEKMNKEAGILLNKIAQLETQIAQEEEKVQQNKIRASLHSDEGSREKLKLLTQKIQHIFKECGFELADSSDNKPIQLLTQIESKLDKLLTVVSGLDEDWVRKQESILERERRKLQREERNQQRSQNQERGRREKKSINDRVVKKRIGKPVMERSQPIEKKQNSGANEEGKEGGQKVQGNKEQDLFGELFGLRGKV